MANANPVVQAILAATSNPQIQAAMLLGSRMESGWSPQAVGDQGTSFGPFQIHLPAHPGVSSQEAEDPQWAVNYMLPTYTNAVAKVTPSLWQGNPALAAATAAYYAERPAKMYAASAYQNDWTYVEQALGGTSVATGGATNNAAGGTVAGATDASVTSSVLGPVETDAQDAFNDIYVFGLIAGGVILTGVGVFLLFRYVAVAAPAVSGISLGGNSNGGSASKPQANSGGTSTTKRASGPSPIRPNRAPQRNGNPAASGRKRQSYAPIGGTVVGRSFTATAGRPKPPPVKHIPPKAISP